MTKCWFSLDIQGNWWFIWIGDDNIERNRFIGKKFRPTNND